MSGILFFFTSPAYYKTFIMEASPNHFESLLFKARDYAETRADLLKLKVADKTSETIAETTTTIVFLLFFAFFLLLFSTGLALLLGEWLGKTYYGFFVVAGLYGIAGVIFHVNRNKLVKTPVNNFIIGKFLKQAQ